MSTVNAFSESPRKRDDEKRIYLFTLFLKKNLGHDSIFEVLENGVLGLRKRIDGSLRGLAVR